MPPPNFARKKRKSHSRGSSARRTRHRNTSVKSDQRSSSADLTSLSSTSKEGIGDSEHLNNNYPEEAEFLSDKPQASQNLKSLPVVGKENNTSVTHIDSSGESVQKKSPSKKRTNKKASKRRTNSQENLLKSEASGNSSINNFESANDSLAINMVQENKLDKLSELLERLDATYKVDSCKRSPSHGKTNSQPNSTINTITTTSEPSSSTPFEGKSEEKHSLKECSKEENLSQEEKQALRKARKEAKKSGKSVVSAVKPTSNSVDFAVKPASNSVDSAVKPTSNSVDFAVKPTSNSVDSADVPQVAKKCEATTIVPLDDIAKSEKSKADLKRERREKQEAQRAAKLTAKTEKEKPAQKSEPTQKKLSTSEKVSPSKNVSSKKKEQLKSRRRLPLLEHLSVPKIDENLSSFNESRIHPAIRTSGICMKDMKIDGSLARVISTLSAIYNLIEDYSTPSSCDLSRDLSDYLSSNIAFINACRPLSEPINNAIRFVKKEINEIGSSVPESQAKETLLSSINSFIHQNIFLASKTLVQNALGFIEDDEVILTFGMSQLVKDTIYEASKLKDNLSVVVADNPGTGSGVHFVKHFSDLKIKVHYRILSDLSKIMKTVSKVIVEAEAVVLNGAAIGHCGMAGLILLASTYSVPVIVLCHTFKFCNIDLTDSLVVNELGDPSVIVNCPSQKFKNYLENWKASINMNVVNLMYDVTPPELINVLVTESSNYPTSVVPVIIRRNYADILGHD